MPQGGFPGGLGGGEFGSGGVELLAKGGELGVEFAGAKFGFEGRGGERGVFIPLVAVGGLVEDAEELVVLGLADGVELVAVALGAADGQAHPDLEGGVGAVFDGGDAVFFVIGPPLGVGEGVAVEGGGDPLFERRLGEEVTRQLIDGELIERLIGVEGVDDPVAVAPDGAEGV